MSSNTSRWIEVAGTVRAEMARANLKVTEMMGVLHVTRPTAYRLHHGVRPYNLQQLELLADWMGIQVDDLVRVKTP